MIGKINTCAYLQSLTTSGNAMVTVEDGNYNQLAKQNIPYTDFPLMDFTFWLVNGILLLPSEY